MNLLLDTHTYLWYISGDSKLSQVALEAIESPISEVFLSLASLWEISIKYSLGRLHLEIPLEELFSEYVEPIGFSRLTISPEHLLRLSKLPFEHRDPFDRLLVAQAQAENFTLVSTDEQISKYDVATLW